MIRKLKSKSGMSIGELLVAMLIVLLVTSGVASGMRLAVTQYEKSMVQSEAKVLCSTLESIITNEIGNTENIELGSQTGVNEYELVSFFSEAYRLTGAEAGTGNSRFYSVKVTRDDGGKHMERVPDGEYGEIVLGREDGGVFNCNQLLSSSAYSSYNLGARVAATYDVVKNIAHVKLEISDNKGIYPLEENFDVILLNHPTRIGGASGTPVYTITYKYGTGPRTGALGLETISETVNSDSIDPYYIKDYSVIKTMLSDDSNWESTDPDKRDKYHFLKWRRKVNGVTTEYEPGTSLGHVTSNITLEAVWTCDVKYILVDDAVAATSSMDPVTKTVEYGKGIELLTNSDISNRPAGYIVEKWMTGANGTGDVVADGSIITEPITVYAKWKGVFAIELYKSTADTTPIATGGYIERKDDGTTYEMSLSYSGDEPVHSSPDLWDFDGWYTKSGTKARPEVAADLVSEVKDGVLKLYAGFRNKATVIAALPELTTDNLTADHQYMILSSDSTGTAYALAMNADGTSLNTGGIQVEIKKGKYIKFKDDEDPEYEERIKRAIWTGKTKQTDKDEYSIVLNYNSYYLKGRVYTGDHGDLELDTSPDGARRWRYDPESHVMWGYYDGVIDNYNLMRWDSGNDHGGKPKFKVTKTNKGYEESGKVYIFEVHTAEDGYIGFLN